MQSNLAAAVEERGWRETNRLCGLSGTCHKIKSFANTCTVYRSMRQSFYRGVQVDHFVFKDAVAGHLGPHYGGDHHVYTASRARSFFMNPQPRTCNSPDARKPWPFI